jgi:hypothetical protein
MLEKLDDLFSKFNESLESVKTQAEALNLKSEVLGKKGSLSEILSHLEMPL